MIIIEIVSTETRPKSGVKAGKPWTMNFQQCLYHGVSVDGFTSNFPRESTIQLDDTQAAFPVGKYVLSAHSFYFGEFGRLTLGRQKLQPLADFLEEIKKQVAALPDLALKRAA